MELNLLGKPEMFFGYLRCLVCACAGISRLKRVVLLGDHHQLPPVVKNRVRCCCTHVVS